MTDTAELIIRPLHQTDSLEALTELLHRAYAPLAEMGFRYFATHQTVEQTRKRIAAGSCVVADLGATLVGTVTWYREDNNPKSPELYRRADVAHFAQFGVEPALQRQGVGLRLLQSIQDAARDSGCTIMALDTAEGAEHLVKWYERLGFQIVGHTQWDVTNYRSVIMTKQI
jgi:GNAT superfamily N-acetyltransferase